jgi:OOP family OmpA-OmpF porin
MKLNPKKTTLLLTGILLGGRLFAQTTADSTAAKDYVVPFSGSKMLNTWSVGVSGGITTMYNILSTKDQSDFTHPASSLGYGLYIKKQVLPAIGIQADFLRGTLKGSSAQPDPSNPLTSYSTKLNWSGTLGVVFTFANVNWENTKPVVQPYISAAAGFINYTPVIQHTGGPKYPFKDPFGKNNAAYETQIPVGVGVKFNVSNSVNIDLGYQISFVNTDNLDGYNYGSNSDKFSYIHLGLEYAFGSHKKPQMATHNPVASLRTEYLTGDVNTKAAIQSELDVEKNKNAKLRDDVNATLTKMTTDSDGDGVPDVNDKCPNTPAGTKVDGAGCPLVLAVTEVDKKVITDAIKDLEFDYGKATLRPGSLPGLDKVADLLITKNFSLKLGGHTDSKGSAKLNMILSKARAESIKHYLVSKGANPSRIEAVGYGQGQPIASNKTAKGRQINRRVEFTLY